MSRISLRTFYSGEWARISVDFRRIRYSKRVHRYVSNSSKRVHSYISSNSKSRVELLLPKRPGSLCLTLTKHLNRPAGLSIGLTSKDLPAVCVVRCQRERPSQYGTRVNKSDEEVTHHYESYFVDSLGMLYTAAVSTCWDLHLYICPTISLIDLVPRNMPAACSFSLRSPNVSIDETSSCDQVKKMISPTIHVKPVSILASTRTAAT